LLLFAMFSVVDQESVFGRRRKSVRASEGELPSCHLKVVAHYKKNNSYIVFYTYFTQYRRTIYFKCREIFIRVKKYVNETNDVRKTKRQ
jgi:hypothetical protein